MKFDNAVELLKRGVLSKDEMRFLVDRALEKRGFGVDLSSALAECQHSLAQVTAQRDEAENNATALLGLVSQLNARLEAARVALNEPFTVTATPTTPDDSNEETTVPDQANKPSPVQGHGCGTSSHLRASPAFKNHEADRPTIHSALDMVAAGLSNETIAKNLRYSPGWVQRVRTRSRFVAGHWPTIDTWHAQHPTADKKHFGGRRPGKR